MTESILNFLVGGVGGAFVSLKDVFIDILSYIIRLACNGVFTLITPIISAFNQNIPFLDDLADKMKYIFDFVTPYVNYALDFTFLSQPIIVYIAASIIGRIIIKNGSFIIKMLIQWYEKIVP